MIEKWRQNPKMPSNVEIKAKVEDFVKVVRKAKELSASEGYYCCGICYISECHYLILVEEPHVYGRYPKRHFLTTAERENVPLSHLHEL